MPKRLDSKDNMSLYGEDGDDAFLLVSLGIAYKLNDDAIWFVKVPIDDGSVVRDEAVMVRVEEGDPGDHEEHPDEQVVLKAVSDVSKWYKNR